MSASPHPLFCTQCGQELTASALFCPACGAPRSAAVDADPLVGKVLGQRFLVLERMGHGGSGTMYRGEHTTLRRKVAIKVLHHELCQNDLAVERFRREAITVSNIDNDHIVEIYDLGRAPDERLYLAMELLQGESLQTAIEREKRLPIEHTIDILIQAGEALSEAHAMGYVHRDLRPCNIFLAVRRGRTNFVKLLDFGLAKLVEDEGNAAMTSLGMNFGDPKYMSPEQARGETIDRRSDIYALGCIAYEMLVGHTPFARGKAFEILARHADATPVEPRAVRDDVPLWLSNTIMRMLAKQPEARFVTVYRLVEALRSGVDTGRTMADEVAWRRETIQPPIGSRTPSLRPPTDGPGEREDATGTSRAASDVEPGNEIAATPAGKGAHRGGDSDEAFDPRRTEPGGHAPAKAVRTSDERRSSEPDARPARPEAAPDSERATDEPPTGDEAAGLSGAWFAAGDLDDPDAKLDENLERRLTEARDNVARDADSSFDELYYEPKNQRLLLIAGAIIALIVVIGIVALAWPSSDSDQSSDETNREDGPTNPADVLARIDAVDAGVPGADDAGAGRRLDAGAPDATPGPNDDRLGNTDSTTRPDGRPDSRPGGNRRPPPGGNGGQSGDDDDDGDASGESTSVDPKDAQQAAFFAKVGQTQLRNGQLGSAAGSFKKAIDLDPGNPDALMGQGEIALQTGAPQSAIKLLRAAARKKGSDAHLLTLLGDAYLRTGQAEKAADYFKRALRIDPDSARARDGYNEAAAKIPPPPEDDL